MSRKKRKLKCDFSVQNKYPQLARFTKATASEDIKIRDLISIHSMSILIDDGKTRIRKTFNYKTVEEGLELLKQPSAILESWSIFKSKNENVFGISYADVKSKNECVFKIFHSNYQSLQTKNAFFNVSWKDLSWYAKVDIKFERIRHPQRQETFAISKAKELVMIENETEKLCGIKYSVSENDLLVKAAKERDLDFLSEYVKSKENTKNSKYSNTTLVYLWLFKYPEIVKKIKNYKELHVKIALGNPYGETPLNQKYADRIDKIESQNFNALCREIGLDF